MTGHHAVRRRTVRANDVEFVVLEAGTGPLALCLHGFPDAAPTWRHLLPELAAAGFHAVAPFMRGYAPTAVPRDGNYSIGALVADAVALHQVMGGDEQAVLIQRLGGRNRLRCRGLRSRPLAQSWSRSRCRRSRWIRCCSPTTGSCGGSSTCSSSATRRRGPRPWWPPMGCAFIDQLWRDWSPGYDATGHLAEVKDCLRDPANLSAAIGYYRAPACRRGLAEPAGMQPKSRPRCGPPGSPPCTCTAAPTAASARSSSPPHASTSPLAPGW